MLLSVRPNSARAASDGMASLARSLQRIVQSASAGRVLGQSVSAAQGSVAASVSIQKRFGGGLPHSHYLDRSLVEGRIVTLLKSYPKIPSDKVTASAHFMKDLGLDSLDCVEVVLELEDEFQVVINDADAAHMVTVADAVECTCPPPVSPVARASFRVCHAAPVYVSAAYRSPTPHALSSALLLPPLLSDFSHLPFAE